MNMIVIAQCHTSSSRRASLLVRRHVGLLESRRNLSSMRIMSGWEEDHHESPSHQRHPMVNSGDYNESSSSSSVVGMQHHNHQHQHHRGHQYRSPYALYTTSTAVSSSSADQHPSSYYHVSSLEKTLETVLEMQRLGQIHNDTSSWEGVVRSSIFSSWQKTENDMENNNNDYDDESSSHKRAHVSNSSHNTASSSSSSSPSYF